MLFVIWLLAQLVTDAASSICYSGCFCYYDTLNCTKLSITEMPIIPDMITNVDLSYNLIFDINTEQNLNNLELLDLSHNRLKKIELNLNRSYLKTIKLKDNPIKVVNINSTMLINLDISYCDISHLENDFLDTLPALQVLDVSYNPLKVLHPLSGNLKEFYLKGSLLTKINFNLPYLDIFDISNNRFMTLLKLESNLTILKAEHCSFYQVDLTLPKLKILDISNNKLSQVFLNNPSLELLDVSWNSLRSFHLIDVGLLKLDLSHNLLQDLELTIANLLHLNVSFNPLSILKVYSRPMEIVDCAFCQLKTIELPPVNSLNLTRNGLEKFNGEAVYLDLSHNLLDSYNGKAQFVDLRGNRLSIPRKVTISGSAFLGNNPWLCKCDDSALKELYKYAIDRVTCASPEGKTWESCYVTRLPKYMNEYPWVPLVASAVLTVLVVIGVYVFKKRLWEAERISNAQSTVHDYEASDLQPIRERLQDRLPSYEEALLMNKPNFSSCRSVDIVPNRRVSSSSI